MTPNAFYIRPRSLHVQLYGPYVRQVFRFSVHTQYVIGGVGSSYKCLSMLISTTITPPVNTHSRPTFHLTSSIPSLVDGDCCANAMFIGKNMRCSLKLWEFYLIHLYSLCQTTVCSDSMNDWFWIINWETQATSPDAKGA